MVADNVEEQFLQGFCDAQDDDDAVVALNGLLGSAQTLQPQALGGVKLVWAGRAAWQAAQKQAGKHWKARREEGLARRKEQSNLEPLKRQKRDSKKLPQEVAQEAPAPQKKRKSRNSK